MNQLDICKTIFEATEANSMLPDTTADFCQLLTEVESLLNCEQYNALYQSAMIAVANAQENGFKLGWQLRGQL